MASYLMNGKMDKVIKILFLAANPRNSSRLRLDEEIRSIDQALRLAEYRDRFEIQQHWAVRVSDLHGLFLRHQPHIVHFSGHGSSASEIMLEDEQGRSAAVSKDALAQLFSILKDNIRCVVLNACYSEPQAQAISEHIDCVVGMSQAIGDKAAIKFSAAFYQALGYGRDVETAFELGCLQINLARLNEQDTPQLLSLRNPKEVLFIHNLHQAPDTAVVDLALYEQSYRDRIKQRFAEDVSYYVPLAGETTEIGTPPTMPPRSARRRHQRAKAEYHELIQVGHMIVRVKLNTLRAGFDKYPCIILLGDPGSGKTTALENLAYQLASDPERAPLPLRLAEFEPGLTVEEFIVQSWGGSISANHWGASELASALPHFLETGQLFFLFDALNEMPHEGFEDRVQALRQFINKWADKGNRFLVTCRVLDYGEELSDLQRIEIKPLDNDRVRRFLQNELPQSGNALWHAINQNEGLLTLARNPYMLTVMIDIFTEDGQLGQNRAGLMNQFTQILMKWARGKMPADEWIAVDVQREALSTMAFEMQRRAGSGSTVQRDAIVSLMPQQVQTDPNWLPRPSPPEQILTLAANAKLIEMPVDRSSVRFYHQLLQEYFAARQLLHCEADDLDGFWRWPWLKSEMPPLVRSGDKLEPLPPPPATGWEETTILAAGLAPENDPQLLRALIQVNPVLAGRCLHEGQLTVDQKTRQAVIEALLVTIARSDVARRVRIAAGNILGYLGDPRLGVFVPVPAGEFWMGSEADSAVEAEKPAQIINLAGFQMARYPLTNVEYGRFIEADGYNERRFWTEAGWDWRQGNFGPKPADYGEQFWRWLIGRKYFDRPEYWSDPRWNKPNYPVVGITWYEAVAYTRWLTEVWRAEGQIEPGVVARLPTEAEWEKAARGGLRIPATVTNGSAENPLPQRTYPWGNNFDAERLNVNVGDEPVGGACTVGIFPGGESPYGCVDMSGNVWEWCSSLFRPYPYEADDGREQLDGRDYRVMRGQSWFEADELRARCSYRGKGHPATFSGALFGLRVLIK
ncbi:MAG: SUMF1/EgtB/PvdO family nonheme iron enzyme [Chloroflexi bacterium]|nr:SUMF1/EgtB/PvdO family nonheme iron enzyme [Chloroflexota bacterium]